MIPFDPTTRHDGEKTLCSGLVEEKLEPYIQYANSMSCEVQATSSKITSANAEYKRWQIFRCINLV